MKIPTYKSKVNMTTQSPSVESNIQIDPSQNIYQATKSLTNFLTDEYVKEAKLEADNKATLALNELFINQKDGTKGLYSIQAETKTNGEPLVAAKGFDNSVNKLWSYAEANNLQGFNNLTKKALEKKFYATAGMFKAKALEGSRLSQIDETKSINNDTILKEIIALKLNGPSYIPKFEETITARLNSTDVVIDKGILEAEKNRAFIVGQIELANDLAANNPQLLIKDINKFDKLNLKQKLQVMGNAEKTLQDLKFQALTSGLNIAIDSPATDLKFAVEEIENQNFGGNKELQKVYQNLTSQERSEFKSYYLKKISSKRTELSQQALLEDATAKININRNYKEIYNKANPRLGVDIKRVNERFQNSPIDLKQITDVQEKILDNTKQNKTIISDFDANNVISAFIATDKINTISDKFLLPGEKTPMSIQERFSIETDLDDINYYSNILSLQQEDNEEFKKVFLPFQSFINQSKNEISTDVIKLLAPEVYNKDLNKFKVDMYKKYTSGLEEGKSVFMLLDYNSPDYIGKNFIEYQSNKNEIYENMKSKVVIPDGPERKKGETATEYLKRIEGN